VFRPRGGLAGHRACRTALGAAPSLRRVEAALSNGPRGIRDRREAYLLVALSEQPVNYSVKSDSEVANKLHGQLSSWSHRGVARASNWW